MPKIKNAHTDHEIEINRNIKVLMYHRVLWEKPVPQSKSHFVTAVDFENQMKWLDRLGYTTITLADYALYLNGELSLPKKPIIITFDDGYLDTFETAIPIMLKYNMRGVIFVMGNRSLRQAKWDEDETEEPCSLMSDDQIRMAESLGFEIGAHSMSHADLMSIDGEELEHEIMWSKYQVEQVLGKPVLSFAYPYGRVDEKVQEVALESGFQFACGVYTGPAWFGENIFDIRRLAIDHTVGELNFLLRILTPYEFVEWSYTKLKDSSPLWESHEPHKKKAHLHTNINQEPGVV